MARCLKLLAIVVTCLFGLSQGKLQVGFYKKSCPNVEAIVRGVVREAVVADENNAPVLMRLNFHDCFVEGCDGSILIDNGLETDERRAFGHQGVRGFDVIEKAKAQLEAACPGIVSCADIVAMAARDAVLLVPAHTIGTTACFFMNQRLYNFPAPGGSDPSINPNFLQELKTTCPQNGDVNVRLPMDQGSEHTFDTQILENIKAGFAVLQSDASLYQDESTKRIVDSYTGLLSPFFGPSFQADFAAAMVKMGRIGVLTGSKGRIRRVCSSFN
ncbi:Peroxidase [Handroanthus impetiginosus]|uniref:peroxidase n=1 Tax=Handroanthus impetiginosus TaxID=429701 RepID=A0A2G9GWC0_9LAMI|nr:Peroxidase [Handroanthus impetiginosus]